MSVQDLIWVNIAQSLKFKHKIEAKTEEIKSKSKVAETLYLAICDCREISRDTNLQIRMLVAAKIGQKRVKAFDPKELPSIRVPEEQREAELMAKMTPEELKQKQIEDFLAGKTVRI